MPSAEAGLHARIAAVTGADAVVHVHAMAAVAAEHWFPDGVPLRDLEMLKGFGRSGARESVVIPVVPNSQDMGELGGAFEPQWDGRTPALVVARHGMYVWGRDLSQARHHTEFVEFLLPSPRRPAAPVDPPPAVRGIVVTTPGLRERACGEEFDSEERGAT